MKRYILHTGYVESKSDGQRHFIGAAELARLYGVDMRNCVVDDENGQNMRGFKPTPDDVHLWPSYRGDYTLREHEK